jgi:ribosome-associated protein
VSAPTPEALARRLAEIADAKKAEAVTLLDMRGLVSYTDFLLVCTARNERQAAGIVEELRIRLKREEGLLPSSVEGVGAAGWVILDYLDCVVHVQTAEARERYRLEELWHEAPRVELGSGAATVPAAGG